MLPYDDLVFEKRTHQDAKLELEKQRQQMVSTLTEQFIDDKNEVEQDLSVYWEHS